MEREHIHRAVFALCLLLFFGAGFLYLKNETEKLEITRERLPFAGAGAAKVAVFSDLHLKNGLDGLSRRAALAIREENPQIVISLGDQIENAKGLGALDEFLALAMPPEARLYGVLGNWERDELGEEELKEVYSIFKRRGGEIIDGKRALAETTGGRIAFYGVAEKTGHAALAALLAEEEKGVPEITLVHNPYVRDTQAFNKEGSADLMLAGHTHGFQISPAKFLFRLFAEFSKYDRGWYSDGPPPPLFVTRGVGTSHLPFRLWSRPEVVILEIRAP